MAGGWPSMHGAEEGGASGLDGGEQNVASSHKIKPQVL